MRSKRLDKYQTDKFIKLVMSEGYSVSEASRQVGISYNQGYKLAKGVGWDKSLRNTDKCHNVSFNKLRKSKLSVDEILERYDANESQISIAKKAGISREALRQIVIKNGRKGAREKQQDRAKANKKFSPLLKLLNVYLKQQKKREEKRKRYQRDLCKWKIARELWAQDVYLKEIAKILDIPANNLNWYIGKLRKKYGWFPVRKPFGLHRIHKLSEEEKRQKILNKYNEIIPLYNQGLTFKEIANILQKPKSWVGWGVHKLRKYCGLCPKRIKN